MLIIAHASEVRRVIDPLSFKTKPLQQIAAYWLSKARPHRLPGRADIKPEELVPQLPYVYLVDVKRDPLAFRYRLVGTAIRQWGGREFTGISVNEVEYGAQWREIFEEYRTVAERSLPTRSERASVVASKEFHYYERFLGPLASDGATIDMIFGALHVIGRPDLPLSRT